MRRIKKYWRVFISLFLIIASKLQKRKENRIAFGAWKGELYIDNSRYLLETALKTLGEDYRFVWIGNKEVAAQLPHDSRICCYEKNSLRSLSALLKCKYMFCSQMHYEDLSNYNVFEGAIITYLHHGCPVKRWGDDAGTGQSINPSWQDRIVGKRRLLDYFVCSSETHFRTNLSSMKSWGCNEKNNLRTGTPRNDMLLLENDEEHILKYKQKYAEMLGFDVNQKVVLYVPTFRRSGIANESLVYRDSKEKERLSELLHKHNCVLIEKAHYAGEFESKEGKSYDNILSCPKKVNIQEMLLFTDCMISDYSGAFLDYSILDRPIIHYIYDYEFYRDVDSGLYYELNEFQAGSAARNYDELLNALESCLTDPKTGEELRRKVKNKFMEYEQGNASEQIIGSVLRKETV